MKYFCICWDVSTVFTRYSKGSVAVPRMWRDGDCGWKPSCSFFPTWSSLRLPCVIPLVPPPRCGDGKEWCFYNQFSLRWQGRLLGRGLHCIHLCAFLYLTVLQIHLWSHVSKSLLCDGPVESSCSLGRGGSSLNICCTGEGPGEGDALTNSHSSINKYLLNACYIFFLTSLLEYNCFTTVC